MDPVNPGRLPSERRMTRRPVTAFPKLNPVTEVKRTWFARKARVGTSTCVAPRPTSTCHASFPMTMQPSSEANSTEQASVAVSSTGTGLLSAPDNRMMVKRVAMMRLSRTHAMSRRPRTAVGSVWLSALGPFSGPFH